MTPELNNIVLEYNKSVEYLNRSNYKKAEQILTKILKQYPFKEGYTNLANICKFTGRDKQMFANYYKALDPKVPYIGKDFGSAYHIACSNLGLAYYMYDDDNKAIELYDKALESKPDFYDAIWNKSTAVLRQACEKNDYKLLEEGWRLYDARFKKTPPVVIKNNNPDLCWWDFNSKYESIIVLAEQGIGDNLMWARWLGQLHDVTVQCDPSLEEIFKFMGYKTLQDPMEFSGKVAVPMCSLGRLGGLPNGEILKGFGNDKKFNDENFNVGIVWAGNANHSNDAYRSIHINRFRNLSKYCSLYSLSPDFKGNQFVKSLDIKSWADTAGWINALDLVITIDSSVAHMCGCLGRECWVLMPSKETDFRWGLTGSSNIWYPSVKVFRNPGSWEFVFSQVEEELRDRLCV